MKSEGRYGIRFIIGTILLVISMAFQTIAWILHDSDHKGYVNLVRILRGVSVCVFVIGVIVLLLIYSAVSKQGKKNKKDVITFNRIATSLAGDYDSVFYLNTMNDSYKEYARVDDDNSKEKLRVVSGGVNFFEDLVINVERMVVEADREKVLSVVNKDYLYKAFRDGRVIDLDYRLIQAGAVLYYHLKVTKGCGEDDKYIVIGVRNNDKQMKEEKKNRAAAEQGKTYGQIAQALASRYEVLYYVNTDTDEYVEYSASKAYSKLDIGVKGRNFFKDCQMNMVRDIYTDDYPMMAAAIDKKNLLEAIDKKKVFSITYRLLLNGIPEYVNLRAVRPRGDEHHMVVGVININDSMQREEEFKERLDTVMNMANRDALTGVKNKNAYNVTEKEIDEKISEGVQEEFAVAFCDVNNLKRINDSQGHKAGDEYIREACAMICRVFKHSPVYRVGGDEFSVVLKGEDYENRVALLGQIKTQVEMNKEDGKVVISIGISDYDPDNDKSLSDVFERADREMYANKKELKS